MRMMGAESVAYHRATVLGRGDDFPGQALAYYASRGETPLVWGGDGAARLGLAGAVSAEAYEAVFGPGGARHPVCGERLVASRRPGMELVISAHKSVAELRRPPPCGVSISTPRPRPAGWRRPRRRASWATGSPPTTARRDGCGTGGSPASRRKSRSCTRSGRRRSPPRWRSEAPTPTGLVVSRPGPPGPRNVMFPRGSCWPAGGRSWRRSAGRSPPSTRRSTPLRGPGSSARRASPRCTGSSAWSWLMTVRRLG